MNIKKYILLGEIMGIGGWQLYDDARVFYEKKLGYQVYIIGYRSFEEEVVKLDTLKKTNALIRDEYSLPPYVFSNRQIKAIISEVCEFIDYNIEDEIVVESTSIPYSLWGELIAEKLNAHHFAYILHSHIEKKYQRMELQKFYEFKYRQGLLAGMATSTVREMFVGYSSFTIEQDNWIPASWGDPLTDDNSLLTEISLINELKNIGFFAIGYFGTLNKPHFLKLCQDIQSYVEKHLDQKILFVSIGSSKTGNSENEQNILPTKNDRIKTINIPEMYPVSRNLFLALDCCIASWGSSVVAARSGVQTIRLENDTDTVVQGIVGYGTLRKWPYSTCESEHLSLEEAINRILKGGYYKSEEYVPPISTVDFIKAQENEQLFLNNAIERNEELLYYDVMKIKCENRLEYGKKILYHFIGKDIGEKIRRFIRKVRNAKKGRING